MEEIGRRLMPSPFLSTGVLAASALDRGGSSAQKSAYLPQIASGSLLAALAIDEGTKHRPLQTALQAGRPGKGFPPHRAEGLGGGGPVPHLRTRAPRTPCAAGQPQGRTLF